MATCSGVHKLLSSLLHHPGLAYYTVTTLYQDLHLPHIYAWPIKGVNCFGDLVPNINVYVTITTVKSAKKFFDFWLVLVATMSSSKRIIYNNSKSRKVVPKKIDVSFRLWRRIFINSY